jgi:dynein heavy chain
VTQFPSLEPPALFGLHDNAALTSKKAQASAFFESMMLLQRSSAVSKSSAASSSSGSSEDGIAAVARDILARLPPLFDVVAAQAKYAACGLRVLTLNPLTCGGCMPSCTLNPFTYNCCCMIALSTFVRFPVRYEDSMNTVLTQELVRFNALVDTVCNTLNNLLLALKGSVLMSSDLDDVANSLRSR